MFWRKVLAGAVLLLLLLAAASAWAAETARLLVDAYGRESVPATVTVRQG
jgi:hypothetical protein